MNAINYQWFIQKFSEFVRVSKEEPERIISMGRTRKQFIENIQSNIENCRIFEIDDNIKKMLALTNPPNKNDDIKLPYPVMFLDVAFMQQELADLGIDIKAKSFRGLLFSKGNLLLDLSQSRIPMEELQENNEDVFSVGSSLRITVVSEQQDGSAWFDTFSKNINIEDEWKDKNVKLVTNPTSDKNLREFVHKFVINFLNFLNNPEIEYIEHVPSEKNIERRKKQGKLPLPIRFEIKCTGVLKKYMGQISQHESFHYSYRFWVRGHFRHLNSDRYKIKKTLFILPYVKGSGILIDKVYSVEKENSGELK